MRYAALLFMLTVAATGCRSRAELNKALSEAQAAEAQKDSLLTEVLETTQFVSDINSELAKAKSMAIGAGGSDRGMPGAQRDREERKAALQRIDPEGERRQIERVRRVRAERDPAAWSAALARLEDAARGTDNLLPPIIEAVKAYATVGEIADRLRTTWGVHRELITV